MNIKHFVIGLLVFIGLSSESICQTVIGNRYEKIVIHTEYEHTKWGIKPADLIYEFAAFTTSFDSDDDNDEDGDADIWGIPEWVAYEVKKEEDDGPEKYNRPTWMTDDALGKKGWAPDDKTYAVSGTRDLKEVKTDYRYVRGHMCPKDAADRISMEAGYNTHTVLNAVPQLQWQNNGVWKALEEHITDWADEYESVWVVCGPVFFKRSPSVWLGQDGEVKAAVPDALFKLIVREDSEAEHCVEVIAFIFPNIIPKADKDLNEFITTVDRIEALTGLDLLCNLDIEQQMNIEREAALAAKWNLD